jgi:hypothetical protein
LLKSCKQLSERPDKDARCHSRDTQAELGQVSDEAIKAIAKEMNVSTVDVEGVVTFYHFFSKKTSWQICGLFKQTVLFLL